MVENLIKSSSKISLNFDLIREDVKENIANLPPSENKQKNLLVVIKFVLSVMVFGLFTVLLTVNILVGNENESDSNNESDVTTPDVPDVPAGGVNPGINSSDILVEMFDVFVAFGSSSNVYFKDELILNSNIISDEDKLVLKDYISNQEGKYQCYYNIHLGVKDGKNLVVIQHLTRPYKTFYFESNLSYDLLSIIDEFEKMCGKELTQDFLMSWDWDDEQRVNKVGIQLNFKELDGLYIPYFILKIDNKVYVLDK